MKVCHVTMHYQPMVGGQELYIQNLIDICNRYGIRSDVIQPFSFYKSDIKANSRIIYTPVIPKLPQWLKWFVFNFALLFYRKKLKEYDILICHHPFHYPVINWHRKVIVVSHGILFDKDLKTVFDKYLAHTSKSVCLGSCSVVSNDTDFLRFNGLDLLPGQKYFTEVKPDIWFVPNCIDTAKFVDLGAAREDRIVVIRNIRPDRGIDLAIRAFAVVSKRFNGYKLSFIGSIGNRQYFEQCQILVNELDLAERIEFVGHLSQHEVIKQYQRAKLSLVPSISKEGTSLSALESMSCGTPVVSTNIGGLADLPSLQVEVDPEQMGEAMIAIIENWQYYSDNQKTASQTFNLKNWGDVWLKIINKT